MTPALSVPGGSRLRRIDAKPLPRESCARCVRWQCRPDLSVPFVVGECRKGKQRRPSPRRGSWPLTAAGAACKQFERRETVRHV